MINLGVLQHNLLNSCDTSPICQLGGDLIPLVLFITLFSESRFAIHHILFCLHWESIISGDQETVLVFGIPHSL